MNEVTEVDGTTLGVVAGVLAAGVTVADWNAGL